MNLDLSPVTLIFSEKGEITGLDYPGTFKVKPLLSLVEKMSADEDRRFLLGYPKNDEAIAQDAVNSAFCLSQLKARVVDAPAWYKDSNGLRKDFFDTNVLLVLTNKVMEIEQKFRDDLAKSAQEAKEKLSNSANG